MSELLRLYKDEGWELQRIDGESRVYAFGEHYPLRHPVQIYLKKYREETNPELKFRYMKAARDYLWPHIIWHSWTERRFREHCEHWRYIGWAGGANTAKSFDAAQIANLFWLADPTRRGVIIASTTLASLEGRVWGYAKKLMSKMAVKLPFQYLGGNDQKILYPADRTENEIRDTLHGIFAIAAAKGSGDESAPPNWIGRHPEGAMLVILDECTDLSLSIAKAFPNLDSSEKPFQLLGIGNSNSKDDLHGVICTPEAGWESVDPMRDNKWKTTRPRGVCLFFSCYESPTIFETDPERKQKLRIFLVDEEKVLEKEKTLGTDSDSFWRFTLGFWRTSAVEPVMITEPFLREHHVTALAEWLGIHPLETVGGLDIAFSAGGDKCILRLGYLGQTTSGDIVLDFRKEELLFEIKISATSRLSIELQIVNQVIPLLLSYGCPLHQLAIDATGQGRAMGGSLELGMARELEKRGQDAGIIKPPFKIFSTRTGAGKGPVNSFDVLPKTKHELWFDFRKFIESNQILGLDSVTYGQFKNRRTKKVGKTEELESKQEFRMRMAAIDPRLAHSPDHADAATLTLQAAMMAFGFYPGQTRDVPRMKPSDAAKMVAWRAQMELKEEDHGPGALIPTFGSDISESVANRKSFPD